MGETKKSTIEANGPSEYAERMLELRKACAVSHEQS
jgi:hypothetical protein